MTANNTALLIILYQKGNVKIDLSAIGTEGKFTIVETREKSLIVTNDQNQCLEYFMDNNLALKMLWLKFVYMRKYAY